MPGVGKGKQMAPEHLVLMRPEEWEVLLPDAVRQIRRWVAGADFAQVMEMLGIQEERDGH